MRAACALSRCFPSSRAVRPRSVRPGGATTQSWGSTAQSRGGVHDVVRGRGGRGPGGHSVVPAAPAAPGARPAAGSEVQRALPLCTLPRVECHRLTCHRDAAGDGIDRVCRQPGPRGTEPLLAVPGPRVAPCTPASGRCARMNMYRGRRALTTLQGQCLRSLHPFLPSTFTKPQRALHGTTLLSPKTAERTLSKSPPAGRSSVNATVRILRGAGSTRGAH